MTVRVEDLDRLASEVAASNRSLQDLLVGQGFDDDGVVDALTAIALGVLSEAHAQNGEQAFVTIVEIALGAFALGVEAGRQFKAPRS